MPVLTIHLGCERKLNLLGTIHRASEHPAFWCPLKTQHLTHSLPQTQDLACLPSHTLPELPQACDDQYDLLLEEGGQGDGFLLEDVLEGRGRVSVTTDSGCPPWPLGASTVDPSATHQEAMGELWDLSELVALGAVRFLERSREQNSRREKA